MRHFQNIIYTCIKTKSLPSIPDEEVQQAGGQLGRLYLDVP